MPFTPPESVQTLLESRYFQDGEDWDSLCQRVAKTAASVEADKKSQTKWFNTFYHYLREAILLPNTPALVNAGARHKGSVAACFAFRPEDSMDSIMEIATRGSKTLKYGGGVGFELSLLRPEGFPVQSTHKSAMGPVGVMEFYSAIGKMVTQGGIRPSAMMGLLRIDHPDIVKFIKSKLTDGELETFNISVAVTDSFMRKLFSTPEKPHTTHFNNKQYNILPDGQPVLRQDRGFKAVLSVKDIWDIICESANSLGDPGLVFIDEINRKNHLISGLSDSENSQYMSCVNPCSELPLNPNAACVLASIDLGKFVRDGSLDHSGLEEAFKIATRLLDNLIDISDWPDEVIEKAIKENRRIGVGVMGFTSMLDKLGVSYSSEECIKLIKEIGEIRKRACDTMSAELAEERGTYPIAPENEKFRNAFRTVVAPTGSLAMIANTSWSIEPHYYWAFKETRAGERKFRMLPVVMELLDEEQRQKLIEAANGDLEELNRLIQENLPEHMSLVKDITPEQHIEVMSAWQENTDSAISKTLVIAEGEISLEKTSKIFELAWRKNLKGITIYPEGSRANEPMSIKKKRQKIRKRPERLSGDTFKHEVLIGDKLIKAFCTVNTDPDREDQPYEVLLKHPHISDSTSIQFMDLTTRLISIILRYRYCDCSEEAIPLGQVIKQLRETDGQQLYSIPKIFIKTLAPYIEPGEHIGECPECRQSLTLIEGCEACPSCGYRACG